MADKAVEQNRDAKQCWQCGAVYVGHFCTSCGAKAKESIAFCPVCGADRARGQAFCGNCGFSYGDDGVDIPDTPRIQTVSFPAREYDMPDAVEEAVTPAPTETAAPAVIFPKLIPVSPEVRESAGQEDKVKLKLWHIITLCVAAFALIAVVVWLCIGIGNSAPDDSPDLEQFDGLEYEIYVGGASCVITGIGNYNYSDGSVVIPEEINGYRVASIGDSAFYGCAGLTSVSIPYGIESIGERAFSYCTDLQSVDIPNSVTSIGEYAFCNCTSLISVNLSEKTTSIDKGTFYDCKSLKSITIPKSVTSIEEWAFAGCEGLTYMAIPEGVSSIGDYAFNYCSSLTSVTIPISMNGIGSYAFDYCAKLVRIDYMGTKADWNNIYKKASWNRNTNAYLIWCSDGTLEKTAS